MFGHFIRKLSLFRLEDLVDVTIDASVICSLSDMGATRLSQTYIL